MTTGVISAQRQDFGGVTGKNLFQTEASINRGNSGGPLLDEEGTMIGVNSMIARQARDGMVITDVNFSIKSNVALNWLNKLGYRFAGAGQIPSKTGEEVAKVPAQVKDAPVQRSEKPRSPEFTPPVERKEASEEFPEPEDQEKFWCQPEAEREKLFQEGEILTEKNPYDMDELIAGMQEMEDLMDEMRGKIQNFKKRRYP